MNWKTILIVVNVMTIFLFTIMTSTAYKNIDLIMNIRNIETGVYYDKTLGGLTLPFEVIYSISMNMFYLGMALVFFILTINIIWLVRERE